MYSVDAVEERRRARAKSESRATGRRLFFASLEEHVEHFLGTHDEVDDGRVETDLTVCDS